MSQRTSIVVGLVVLVAIVAVALWAALTGAWGFSGKYGDNDVDCPDGIHFICTNEACGAGFTLTVKQLGEHHADDATYGKPVKCPRCQADAGPADWCKTCKRYCPSVRNSTSTCPSCNKPIRP